MSYLRKHTPEIMNALLQLIKKKGIDYAKAGCSEHFEADINRRVIVVNLFAFVGGTISLLLGIRAASQFDWSLAGSLAIASFCFYATRQLQIFKQTPLFQQLASTILQLCLMVLTLFLVISGGNSNTGPLWLYLVPPVCMFLGGFRRGLIHTIAFTLCIAIVLFFPNDSLLLTTYSYEFKSRLLYSFMTIIFLSAFYEYSREQSYASVERLRDEFENQALHDQLTNLPNRRHINEQLKHEYQRTVRSKESFSVLLADVDRFKQINDQYGHDAGDQVLRSLSERFKQSIRKQDLVARWGGEEFLFLLPSTQAHNAEEVANKIRESVAAQPIWQNQRPVNVTISIGVAEITSDDSIDQAINLADKRLYIAKQEGRNMVVSE